jgi:hypothetical protein
MRKSLRLANSSYGSELFRRVSHPHYIVRDKDTIISSAYSASPLEYLDLCLALPKHRYVIGTFNSYMSMHDSFRSYSPPYTWNHNDYGSTNPHRSDYNPAKNSPPSATLPKPVVRDFEGLGPTCL